MIWGEDGSSTDRQLTKQLRVIWPKARKRQSAELTRRNLDENFSASALVDFERYRLVNLYNHINMKTLA